MKKSKSTPAQYSKPQPYEPEPWQNEIARPGGEDNRKWGSLQADGTVKPYRAPIHGCIGELRDKIGHARD